MGVPSPGTKQAEAGEEARAELAPPQARRGHLAGPLLRLRLRRQVPFSPGNMAAPIAAPGGALLRAGAERLLSGARALLRPRPEGVPAGLGRDFSLSHSRVRAKSGLRGP